MNGVPNRSSIVFSNTAPTAAAAATVPMDTIKAATAWLGETVGTALPDGRLVAAAVDDYPIYDPEKKRPRS